jgi:hypothetical protein
MKTLEKLANVEIKKNEMITIKGGTTTTSYIVQGAACEIEYEDKNKNGKLDKDEYVDPLHMGCPQQ